MTDDQLHRLSELSAMKTKERAKSESLETEKKEVDSLRRESPIRLHAPFELTIDWFLDKRAGGSRFKTWAGQQSVMSITEGMHRCLSAGSWSETMPREWLRRSVPNDDLPFNFDSGLSGQGSALDAGFSFDSLGFTMPIASTTRTRRVRRPPAVPPDVGVRPRTCIGSTSGRSPLLPAAACGCRMWSARQSVRSGMSSGLLYRTKYLKSFLPAQPYRGDIR